MKALEQLILSKSRPVQKEAKHFGVSELDKLIREALGIPLSPLNEGKNEGDIMEGIFALAVGLYIAHGGVDMGELTRLRKEVDPSTWEGDKAQTLSIATISGDEGDRLVVRAKLRLKSVKTAGMSYGGDWDTEAKPQIPSIQKKQQALIDNIEKSSFLKKVEEFKNKVLQDDKRDNVLITVIADGKAGETSGGTIKGDVMVRVQASEWTEEDLIDTFADDTPFEEISFSIKSESRTVANRSPFVGMLEVAKWFGLEQIYGNECKNIGVPVTAKSIPEKCAADYHAIKAYSPANRAATQEEKMETARKMWHELRDALVKLDGTPGFKEKIFGFLEQAVFGDDKADVVDLTRSGIKEITAANLDALKTDPSLKIKAVATSKGSTSYLKFYRIPINSKTGKPDEKIISGADLLYHLRVKLRYTSKGGIELKFYPEVGDLSYTPKKKKKR